MARPRRRTWLTRWRGASLNLHWIKRLFTPPHPRRKAGLHIAAGVAPWARRKYWPNVRVKRVTTRRNKVNRVTKRKAR